MSSSERATPDGVRHGAFAVIFDERQRVLLCHRRDMDAWNAPGGGIEDGESPWDAVVRETREEVGLDVRVRRLAGIYWKPERRELVHSFECEIVSGTPSLSDEADDVAYFAFADIPPNTSPNQVARIADALAGHRDAVLRVQSGGLSIRDVAGRRVRS